MDIKRNLQINKLYIGNTGNNVVSNNGDNIILSISGNNVVSIGNTMLSTINGYAINGVDVLSNYELKSGITTSNLQLLGTLNYLNINGYINCSVSGFINQLSLNSLFVTGNIVSPSISSLNLSVLNLNTTISNSSLSFGTSSSNLSTSIINLSTSALNDVSNLNTYVTNSGTTFNSIGTSSSNLSTLIVNLSTSALNDVSNLNTYTSNSGTTFNSIGTSSSNLSTLIVNLSTSGRNDVSDLNTLRTTISTSSSNLSTLIVNLSTSALNDVSNLNTYTTNSGTTFNSIGTSSSNLSTLITNLSTSGRNDISDLNTLRTTISTSSNNLSTSIINLSTSSSRFLQRSEIVLPSTFISSSLTSLGTLNTNLLINYQPASTTTPHSIITGTSSSYIRYTITPLSWDVGCHTFNSSKSTSYSIRNDSIGNCINVLSSGETHIGYSTEINSDIYKLNVNGHTNLASGNNYYINGNVVLSSNTLGAGIINSSLNNIGTTSINPTLNTGAYYIMNSGGTLCLMSMSTSTLSNSVLFGCINDNPILRFGDTGSSFQIQNTSASSIWSIANDTGDVSNTGNLNLGSGKAYSINGNSVLSGNTLGSGIVNSSLQTLRNVEISTTGYLGLNRSSPIELLHIKKPYINNNQPYGFNGTYTVDNKTVMLITNDEATASSLGKIGIQFGGYPSYSIGGIFGNQTDYTNNTIGDITVDLRRGDGDVKLTEVVRFKNNGNVGIGTTNPTETLHVVGNQRIATGVSGGSSLILEQTNTGFVNTILYSPITRTSSSSFYYYKFESNGGYYRVRGDSTVETSSDLKLKENINPVESVIDGVCNLRVVDYTLKGETTPIKPILIGLIAQEVKNIFPELVNESLDQNGEPLLGINYPGVCMKLLRAFQELKMDFDELETEFTEYKNTH